MAKKSFTCSFCKGPGEREAGDYNRKVASGQPLYCSRDCARAMARERGKALRAARMRECETCGETFSPRQVQIDKGGGRYCSQKCNKAFHEAGQAPGVWLARIETMREKRARGDWTVLTGESNPRWRGGKAACVRRLIESGEAARRVRDYRRRNPDKVREFSQRRSSRKVGKLPYGTIPKLREKQGNRCAICTVSLKGGDHLDHIVPLARGGKHEPGNLQLLCPPCNLRKSDRDPIEHMQSLGRLL